jgi:hypothetical protein
MFGFPWVEDFLSYTIRSSRIGIVTIAASLVT